MSCICQYIVNSSPPINGIDLLASVALPESAETGVAGATSSMSPEDTNLNTSKEAVTDDKKISVCISDLAACRSENWLLKKKLLEYEVTIENLEQLMTTIVNKQHQVLSDMFQLRKRNHELQIECNLQREFNSVERNVLMKELHELKTRSQTQTMSGAEDEGEDGNRSTDSEEFEKPQTDSDEACSSDLDSEEDDQSIVSSDASTAMFSGNSSPYSTESEADNSEDSEENNNETDESESE
ncbi:uncharacterized protein LOC132789994 [Drosophila nasuta]|uniref:uncharacterized protein LOC132789994 n=1 Tax=Drosophila nasuta TaxID=42062 RepID=UPI00295E909A|nr:uncharacterized protein LOC132789994 [Drosophila nasuta]